MGKLSFTLSQQKEVATRPPLFYALLIFSLLQTLAWLLPDRYLPWSSFYQEFLSALGFVSLLLAWSIKRLPHTIPPVALIILAVSLIPLLQWVFGLIDLFGDAALSAFYLSGLAAAITIGFDLRHSGINLLLPLGIALIIASLISTFIILDQWLGTPVSGLFISDLPPGASPFGNLGQPNNLATLLYCGLLATAFFWHKQSLSGFVTGLVSVIIVIGIVLTESRTPWVITLAITALWLWKSKTLSLRLKWPALAAVVTGYILCLYAFPVLKDILLLTQSPQDLSISSSGRIEIWKQLWAAIWNGPWYGYGWNQMSHAQLASALDFPAIKRIFLNSHNLFIELLIANGPYIGLLLISVIVWWGATRAHRLSSPEGWFAYAICLAFMTHAMLEFPLNYAYFLLPFGIMLGIIESQSKQNQETLFHLPRYLTIGSSAAAAALLLLILVEYITIEKDFRLLRFETLKIGSIHATQPAPDVYVLTQLREYIRFARTKAHYGATEAELEWSAKVAYRYPYFPPLLWHALRLTINGHPKEAEKTLGYIKKMNKDDNYNAAKVQWEEFKASYPETATVVFP